MEPSGCEHKARFGCALTALPVCCSCADRRPEAENYPVYIDGQGLTMEGKRWQCYCWKCQNYWTSQDPETFSYPRSMATPWDYASSRSVQSLLHDTSRRASTPRSRTHEIPARTTESLARQYPSRYERSDSAANVRRTTPAVDTTASQIASQTHESGRAWHPNPFATREEFESEDYQSPLTGMFTRAWDRYRNAEEQRRAADSTLNEISQRLLYDSIRANRSHLPRNTSLDAHMPQDSALRNAHTNQYPFRPHLELPASLAAELRLTQFSQLEDELEPPPPGLNPIDVQRRPPPIPAAELSESMACKICCDQKMDTLLEPCMHICMCRWCAEILRQRSRDERRERQMNGQAANSWKCPICRQAISGVRRIHIAS